LVVILTPAKNEPAAIAEIAIRDRAIFALGEERRVAVVREEGEDAVEAYPISRLLISCMGERAAAI
jgi:hypothetical protein